MVEILIFIGAGAGVGAGENKNRTAPQHTVSEELPMDSLGPIQKGRV